jgi:hypothetical protein
MQMGRLATMMEFQCIEYFEQFGSNGSQIVANLFQSNAKNAIYSVNQNLSDAETRSGYKAAQKHA